MQKDSIYYMWLCYSVWRDCKINYFSCLQGWSPIVKTTSNFYELSTKPHFMALTAKSSPWCCGDTLCCQKGHSDSHLTLPLLPWKAGCSTRAHPKVSGRAHPAARHCWDAPARRIPTLGIYKRIRTGILLHLGFERKRTDLEWSSSGYNPVTVLIKMTMW